MSKLTFKLIKTLLTTTVFVGIASLSSSTLAETFDIKGTVQKAIALTKVTDLDFGTIFTTSPTESIGTNEENSSKLVLSNTGTVTFDIGSNGPVLSQLVPGTPGSYTSAAIPAGSSVWVKLFNPASPTIERLAVSASPTTCNYADAAEAVTNGRFVLSNGNFSGFFCVDTLTSNRTGIFATTAGTAPAKFSIGAATLFTFDLGATLITQANVNVPETFIEGPYTGSFIMELNF